MNREIPRLIAAAVLGAAIATTISSTADNAPKKNLAVSDGCSVVYDVQTEVFAVESEVLKLQRATSAVDSKLDDLAKQLRLRPLYDH